MQKHIKNYLEYYWVDMHEIMCEECWKIAVDIHHIEKRSHFGKKRKHLQDDISNLIALCRHDHERAELIIEPYLDKEYLKELHNNNL